MKFKKHYVLLFLIFIFSMLILASTLSSCAPIGETFLLPSGQKFTAINYLNESNGEFEITTDFGINLNQKIFSSKFNRIVINYSSDKPLHIYVKYKQGLENITDDFYLEKGNNITFNGLIKDYINNKKAYNLYNIVISSCEGTNTKFKLNSLSTEKASYIKNNIYYLENNKYKVGINLKWGGGISYIEDKTETQSGLSNLINSHDTGRLIQQSYYGTNGNLEYIPGNAFNQKWPYNPVQGGDQYGNAGRIIDFKINNNSIYIKSQPQDWSKNNALTPSYMENIYTIDEDYIKVDNSFIDYSGWEHIKRNQELPAFYTVSYLDKFVFYNGVNSWNDDELTIKSDLPFWGPYEDQCTFTFDSSNTERWCAWIASDINYGIGLYTPNVEQVCAGRYEYDASKSANSNSTNYVSPLSKLKIVSYETIEYSYMITCGSIEEIRTVFKNNKNFTTNDSLDYFSQE